MRVLFILTQVFVAICLATSVNGCGKNGDDKDEKDSEASSEAPPAPSPYTLSINLDVSDQGTDLDSQQMEFLGANHFQAMVYVLVVNVNVSAQLFVPVALLKSALGTIPSLTATNTWTYSYSLTYNNRNWTANLIGIKTSETSVDWQMRVTSNPVDGNECCTDFLFFDGQSSSSGSGSWQLYDPTRPKDAAKLFSVTYDYTSQTEKVLLITINSDKPASTRFGVGSYVRYQVAGNAISMEILDSSVQEKRTISWDRETKEGSHLDPQGNKVCWDTSANNLVDKDCP